MRRNRWIALMVTGLAAAIAGCQVDEVTIGVGNARTEDAFGNPVVRPFDPDESLRLYRYEIERDKPKQEDEEPETPDAGDPVD
jgi:hypothetical protein